jgi:hypothetical protein
MTASDFCAARYIFSCQAGPSTHEALRRLADLAEKSDHGIAWQMRAV